MAKGNSISDRRTILGLAVAAAAAPLAKGTAKEPPETQSPPGTAAADSYRETPHIRAAYERMRF